MARPLHSLAPAEIARLCSAHFGIDVEFDTFLPGIAAINVLLRADSGPLVLKAEYPSPTMSPAHVDWVCRIQERADTAGLPVAAQLPALEPYTDPAADTSSGALALADIAGTSALVRLHEFLPGREAAGAQQPAAYPTQAGRLAARMVTALAEAPAEPAPVGHHWSLVTTGANVIFACDRISALEAAGQVPAEDSAQLSADLALARAHAQVFEADVRPQLAALPQQVVHQDLNDFNILLENGEISGVIDFAEAGTVPRLAELAVAAAGCMIGHEAPLAALDDANRAYQEEAASTEAELTEAESALVSAAAITRLALVACTWTARALTAPPDHPTAATGRQRMRSTWPVLRAVLGN